MTDTKKSDFSQTDDALAELNAALMHLSEAAEGKKREQQSEAKQKDQKLELLTESCTNIVSNIDGIINRLDKILEDNGTSNNNN